MKNTAGWIATLAASSAWAGGTCLAPSFAVPAMDDVALIVLAALVGGVASWVAKRRR